MMGDEIVSEGTLRCPRCDIPHVQEWNSAYCRVCGWNIADDDTCARQDLMTEADDD